MKNKFVTIFLIFTLNLSYFNITIADEFNFNTTELQISESGNIIKSVEGGMVTTRNNEIVITADNFKYNKLTTLLEAKGNVKLVDKIADVIIESNDVFYLKNKDEIYTKGKSKALNGTDIQIDADQFFRYNRLTTLLEAKGNVKLDDRTEDITIYTNEIFYLMNEENISTLGKTNIDIQEKYNFEGYDLTLLKNEMILSSNEKATINDINSNVYKLDQFQYSINEEVLKGKKVFYRRNEEENKEDEYYFETGFFNLKKNEFLGTETNMIFHKTLYDNEENDPRLKAATSYGDEYNTYSNKAVFTSCKKTDKCPPWKMRAKKMRHDKIKKQIIYKNAWLELYDFPVAYFPKFFHPDPSVKRQSGILSPEIGDHDTLGDSIYLPYFFVISDEKDITFKPRLFDNRKVFQTEYRQETKNSLTIVDSSITKGHASMRGGKRATRSHLFTKTNINLDYKEFISSTLEVKYEKTSNDTYLKLFDFIKSPLWEDSRDTLESKIELDLEHENYDFGSSFKMLESLGGSNSDRYTYILPSYNFSKNFILANIDGGFNFSSSGNNTINNTNISTTSFTNDLNYETFDYFSNIGIKTNFEIDVKNINAMSDNSVKYKNTPQSELISAYFMKSSFPLEKKNEDKITKLIPRLSFRLSPHDMKNHSGSGRAIGIGNVFSNNRLSLGDSFETGESLTLGIDFKKEKVNQVSQINKKEKIFEIEEYFDFKLATVFRLNKEKDIPTKSTINEKGSNIFGLVGYKPIKDVSLNYNFSLTNDFNIIEHQTIDASYITENFSTKFSFTEAAGILGDANVVSNETKLVDFKDYHNLSFSTRRNRKINLTEYYDIVYEYKNDCLIAGVKYRKDYYYDNDIIPKEELFFSVTIIPFYTFSPDKMILNKTRVD
jgi:LPS-assembly protein